MPERTAHITGAALWRRVVALALDWMAMWTVFFALQLTGVSFWVLDHHESVAPEPWGTWFLAIFTVAAMLAALEISYTTLLGQTPGMDAVGIRVESRDGSTAGNERPLSLRSAVLRWSMPGLAVALPPAYAAAALAVIGLPALVDRERRTLADRLAGTRVVSSKVAAREHHVADVHVIRFAMEKWLGAVTGDHGVVRAASSQQPDAPPAAD